MTDRRTQNAAHLDALLDDARTVVFLGPGGVGKTTTASATAIAAAGTGRRVAVLTVDPAARLKDALELPSVSGEFHRVPLPADVPGTLDAILLDAKGLFDKLVRRLSPTADIAERVLANPVYRNIAGAFAGSDAYMALEQVLDIAASDAFDLIVVDTPPASHALDLFEAPDRILALLNSRALEYLEQPTRILGGVTSLFAKGILSAVLSGLERMTGLSLLGDISALAADFHLVSPGFKQRAEAIHRLLRAEETRYVLVSTPEPHGAEDTLRFAREVARLGVALDGVIVNRVFEVDAATADLLAGATAQEQPPADAETPARAAKAWTATLARHLVACADDLATLEAGQRRVIEALRDGLEGQQALRGAEPRWLELPAFSPAPVSLAAVTGLARALRREPRSATTAA